jgi:ABC-2 type transport system permease protein
MAAISDSVAADPLAADPPSLSWAARARVWWTILRICIEERLVYRGDFALGTLMRFMPIVTQVFLWGAVFAAARKHEVQGWTENKIIAYYLLTMIGRAFSSMPGLASSIASQVRTGEIKKYLIQPVDMIGFLLLSRVAHKLVYYIVATAPFALIFYLCRGYFLPETLTTPAGTETLGGWPDGATFAAFLASLAMAFLLGFYIEATLGMIGFWFLEVSSLLFVYMLLNFFLSGHMFPIDLLPGKWGFLVELTPLKYLAYFPSVVFLGKVRGPELIQELLIEAAWVAAFMVICRTAFHFGTKRYSAFGG